MFCLALLPDQLRVLQFSILRHHSLEVSLLIEHGLGPLTMGASFFTMLGQCLDHVETMIGLALLPEQIQV